MSQSVLSAQSTSVGQSIPTAQSRTYTTIERLERLPFNAMHKRMLIACGIGWAMDAMDVGLVSYVVAALAADPNFALTMQEKSWVLSIGFVGMAIGAALGGVIADRIGRKTVITYSLALFGCASLVMALSWNLPMLLLSRLVIGLGLGAELPVASTLVSEYAPRALRGRLTVLLESFWAVGWIVAALIGAIVIPATGDWGWRIALGFGAIPVIYAVILRMHIPESVRFLQSQGKAEQAERAVREFEEASGVHTAPEKRSSASTALPKVPVWALFQHRIAPRTIVITVLWIMINFAYYGAFSWLPSLLADQFGNLHHTLWYTVVMSIAQLPGYLLAAWLVEKIGRKKTMIAFLVAATVFTLAFAQASSVGQVLCFGMLMSAAHLGAWGVLYAITPELFPTRLRAAGAGFAASMGRIAAICAPLSVPLLLNISQGGKTLTFICFACAFACATVASCFLPELAKAKLDE